MQLPLPLLLSALLALTAATCGPNSWITDRRACEDGECRDDCRDEPRLVCAQGSTLVCGKTEQVCCSQPPANPFSPYGMGGMGMGMGMTGMGGMGGMGAMPGGFAMPGMMCGCTGCGRGMAGMMGGGFGQMCSGGSQCQRPNLGLMQQYMLQQQMMGLNMARMQMGMGGMGGMGGMQGGMMRPRVGMSIRVCTCPQGMYSAGGMCQRFAQSVVPIGGFCQQNQMGHNHNMMQQQGHSNCAPGAMCMGGRCYCPQGTMQTGQYCSPMNMVMPGMGAPMGPMGPIYPGYGGKSSGSGQQPPAPQGRK